jgi:hypothetical protein
MRPRDFGTNDLRRSEYETACRDFWSAYVMIETGRHSEDDSPMKDCGCPPEESEIEHIVTCVTSRQ